MENFKAFKKKFYTEALIKGAICGISLALIAVGVLWIVLKRQAIVWNPFYYVLIGAGVALAATAAFFLILRPSDKRIAKRLDKRLEMREKTQTMLEFQNEQGDMLEIQRRDTEERLQKAPVAVRKMRNVWQYAAVGALALATIVTAALIPAKTVETEAQPPEKEYEYTDWDYIALAELIEQVRESGLQEDARELVVTELEDLLEDLREVKTDSLMRAMVIDVIGNVDKIVYDVSSYRGIAEALDKSQIDSAKRLAAAIAACNEASLATDLAELRTGLEEQESVALAVEIFASEIGSALEKSGVAAEDPLYVSVAAFKASMEKYVADYEIFNETQKKTVLADKFENGAENIGLAISQQAENVEVRDFVIRRLKEIFGITDAELPELLGDKPLNVEGADEENKPDEGLNGGGLGSGETIYGSNDEIYDPDYYDEVNDVLGGYVKYGESLDEHGSYYSEAFSLMQDGNLPEELKEYILQYFAALYDGSNATPSAGN